MFGHDDTRNTNISSMITFRSWSLPRTFTLTSWFYFIIYIKPIQKGLKEGLPNMFKFKGGPKILS